MPEKPETITTSISSQGRDDDGNYFYRVRCQECGEEVRIGSRTKFRCKCPRAWTERIIAEGRLLNMEPLAKF